VFGCPVYVLDPKLQDGSKIPKWSLHARLGQFLGFSKSHSSSVGLICNLRTNHVLAQFHVVYDQLYSTVYGGIQTHSSTELNPDQLQIFLKSQWDLDDHIYTLNEWDTTSDGPLPEKAPDWDVGEIMPHPTPPQPLSTSITSTIPEFPSIPAPILMLTIPTRSTPPSVQFQPFPLTPSVMVERGEQLIDQIMKKIVWFQMWQVKRRMEAEIDSQGRASCS